MTTASTSRFDPLLDEPYGNCLDCDAVFATEEEMHAHLSETFVDTSTVGDHGHTGRVTNQSREGRIRNHISFAIQDAIYEFMESVERDIDRGDLTADEVREALRFHPDFSEAWQEREDES